MSSPFILQLINVYLYEKNLVFLNTVCVEYKWKNKYEIKCKSCGLFYIGVLHPFIFPVKIIICGGGGGDIRRPFPVVLVKLAFNATRNSPFSMKKCSKMPVFLRNA